MKRRVLGIVFLFLFLGSVSILKAQCYGTVVYDTSATANGSGTFYITTANANELILIAYNGWPSPGAGPVKVDGNAANHINTAHTSNSAVAEVYCYSAPSAGTHTIVCTETNYSSPYYLNMASAFYVTGTCTVLSCDSLATTEYATGNSFGNITTTITTTVPNEMIFGSFVNNTAEFVPYAMTVTGASVTETMHEGDGIDASEGYYSAATAATYTVTTNDGNSCCGGGTVLVAIIPGACSEGGMVVTDTSINPTCGNCDGSIGLAVSGGTSPYTFTWSNATTTDSATGLCGGTYSVTVQDAGCSDTTISVTLVGNNLAIIPTVTMNEPCPGSCAGSVVANVTGGVSPYTYSWAPVGGTANTASSLCAGVYTITVTDKNGCTGTATATITAPAAVTGTSSVSNVLCYGGVGTATVTPSGGTSPYSYQWSPTNQSTAIATNLTAGNYNVTITDINGCTGSLLVSLTQPTPVVASIGSATYPSCNGGTGTATAAGSGGVSPYTYLWSPIGGSNALGTALTAGTYTVKVTDANGCTNTSSIVITQPASLSGRITILSTPPCNGGTGSAEIAGSGGTPNYSYVWHPTLQTNAIATGLTAGTYTVNITDAHSCTGSVTVTISQPTTLTVSATFTHASCGLGNGTATASPVGGTAPYVYAWAPGGQTTATAINLHAGSYTVTVTDKDHCTASASVTVTQPTAVTAAITNTTNISCYGVGDGKATSVAGGGTPAYTYLWTPYGGTGAVGSNMPAGNYTVKITDANGCTATASTTLTQPGALGATISGPVIRCLGKSGVYTVSPTGGTGPYGYSWSPGIGVSNPGISNPTITPAGTQTYTVTVTDAHGCTINAYESFSFPPPLAVSINGSSVTCSGRIASLCALATGGTGGDTYTWEPVNLGSPCITVPVSQQTTYTITVEDNCQVSVSASTVIHVNPPPAVVFTASTSYGCAPMCVQFRNLTASTGGKEQYIWGFGNGDSVLSENPIYCYQSNGVYNVTLTVISDSGCSSSLTKVNMITVYGRPQAAFTYSPQPVSILTPTVEFMDESTDVNGIAYRFWNFGDNSDSTSSAADPIHTYQDTGTYCATLIAMNSRGCTDTVTNCLIVEPAFTLYIPSAFTPNGDGLNETFQPVGKYLKNFEMYIFDRWGLQLYHTTNINAGWNGTVNGGSTISQEDTYVYKITVTDAENISHSYIGNVTLLK